MKFLKSEYWSSLPIKTIGFGVITLLLIANLFIMMSNQTNNENSISYQRVNSVIKSKAYSFAGEFVPTEDPEVLERLDREISSNVYWQGNTLQILKLSERFFPIIEPILRANGVPEDFKYLAVAESGLRDAVSPANAVGKWQFLKGTAQGYGLVVNEEIDERYHVEKATEAACQYFNEAFRKYGNWTAVAASYNMGMTGYQGRVNEQLEDNYYNLWLNSETSRYVFRIIAYKEIMENPKAYGYIYNHGRDAYPEQATDKKFIPVPTRDLALWAKENGTNYKSIRYLNPWIRSNKITSSAQPELVLLVPRK